MGRVGERQIRIGVEAPVTRKRGRFTCGEGTGKLMSAVDGSLNQTLREASWWRSEFLCQCHFTTE